MKRLLLPLFSAFVFVLCTSAWAGDDMPRTVEVLIAKRDLNVHERLSQPEKLFTKVTFRAGDEPVDAVASFEGLESCTLKYALRKGFPLRKAALHEGNDRDIPPYGIGVRISRIGLPRYYARLPGTRVDLVLLVRSEKGVQRIVILENVLVLAAAGPYRVTDTSEIMTFALKRADVLKLNLAMELGEIRVIVTERMESHESFDTK